MSSKILIIHASDADQHLGRVQGILGKMQVEKRISSFTTLAQESVESETFKGYVSNDLVIPILTVELGKKIHNLINLSSQSAEFRSTAILIDDVKVPTFYTVLPESRKPIRTEIDMDKVWNGIEGYLTALYPEPEAPKTLSFWKKYKVYIIIALVFIVIFLLGPPESCTQDPEPTEDAVESEV